MLEDVVLWMRKVTLQGGLTSAAIKAAVPKTFRTSKWVGIAKRARIIYYSPERVTGAELSGMTYEGLADPKWKGRLVIRKSSNIYNKSLVASLIKNNGKKLLQLNGLKELLLIWQEHQQEMIELKLWQ